MSKRHQHIEKWLQQAAAQHPEVSPEPVKQQAWAQLSKMLDDDDDDVVPFYFWSGWWVILLEVLVLAGGFAYLRGNSVMKVNVVKQLNITDEQRLKVAEGIDAGAVKQWGSSGNEQLEGTKGIDAGAAKRSGSSGNEQLKVAEGIDAGLVKQFGSSGNEQLKVAEGIDAGVVKQFGSSGNEQLKVAEGIDAGAAKRSGIAGNGRLKGTEGNEQLKRTASFNPANAKQQNSNTSTVAPVDLASGKNAEPPRKSSSFAFTTVLPHDTPESLHTLLTKQLFIAVTDSRIKKIPTTTALHIQKEIAKPSGLSIRVAALLPVAEAYGAGANVEYTFLWKNKWRVRPYIGAEYLTGFNKAYHHYSYTGYDIPGGSPGGPAGSFHTDSTLTDFLLKGMMYGKAGIQATYTFSKWEASAGIEYRYLLKTFGKETSSVTTGSLPRRPDNLQPVLFNKKQITGSGNVRLQLGLDYWIGPRMQIGAVYYMQVTKHKVDSSYQPAAPKLPDQTSLQIHARYYLKKR